MRLRTASLDAKEPAKPLYVWSAEKARQYADEETDLSGLRTAVTRAATAPPAFHDRGTA